MSRPSCIHIGLRRYESHQTRGGEQGQALILVVLTMAVMFGFAALAIDGGNYYSHRRQAQNASDSGTLAGAYAMVSSETTPSEAALLLTIQQAVESNGIPDSNGVPGDGINEHVSVFYTMDEGTILMDGEGGADYNCDGEGNCPGIDGGGHVPVSVWERGGIRVVVHYPLDTYLARLLGLNRLPVEAGATAVYDTGYSTRMYSSNALIALSEDDCDALKVTGEASVQTAGGGIFVNSNAHADECHAATAAGTGFISGGTDGTLVVGSTSSPGEGWFEPPLTEYPEVPPIRDPLASLQPPVSACAGAAVPYQGHGFADVILPGHYSNIKQTGGTLTLAPGIYCIDSPQTDQGLTATGESTIAGEGVLLYFKRGSLNAIGGAVFNLAPMTSGPYAGLLIFSDRENSPTKAEFHFVGASGTTFSGTVYAPNNACMIEGEATNLTLNSQIICDTVEVNGSGVFLVSFEPGKHFSVAIRPTISLYY